MTPAAGWSEERAPGPRPGRWFASEWGLAILALVLALLVWAVVWREIADQDEPFEVRFRLETSGGFTAFYEGKVDLKLQGPRGEIEAARRSLPTPPVLNVRLPDLAPGEDHREIAITREMIDFPFPARLVGALELEGRGRLPNAAVYRIRPQQVVFLAPAVTGVPRGIGYEVRMEPRSHPIAGPAGKVGTPAGEIEPDAIPLAAYFPEGARDLPGETRIECAFGDWRNDPENARFRRDIELPKVEAVFTFSFTATKEISNRVVLDVPDEYEVQASLTERYADGRFKGVFQGRQRDLDRLERSTDAWWFVVRVPTEKLPAEGETQDTEGLVEFFRAASLDDLQVELTAREILLLTIRRKE